MSRDRTSGPDRSDDDSFSDALDDLFGPTDAEQNPEVGETSPDEPEQSVHHSPAQYTQPVAPLPTQPSYPQAPPGAPPGSSSQGRSIARVLGLGCAGILGLLVVCFVILMIIGLVSGDTSST